MFDLNACCFGVGLYDGQLVAVWDCFVGAGIGV